MSCADNAPLVEQRPLGLLEPAEAERLEAHLAACEGCRGLAAAVGAAWTELTAAADAAAPAPEGLRERVVEAAAVAARVDEEWMAGARRSARGGDDVKATLDQEKPGPGGPTWDPARVDAIGAKIALTCAYCHAKAARDDIAYCAACLAPHHAECFRSHGRCSLPGCGELLTVRPGRLEAPPAAGAAKGSPWVRAGLGAVIVVLGAVAALNLLPSKRDALLAGRPRLTEAELAAIDSAARQRDEEARAAALAAARREREAREQERRVPRVRLDFAGAPLREVVAAIASQSGRHNIIIDPTIDETVTLTLVDVPWPAALRELAAMTRCRIEPRDGGILAIVQPPKVTIQFTDANVRTVLQLAAAYSGKNVIVDSSVGGTVTMDLKEVPWDQALLAVSHAAHTKVHVLGDVLYIGGTPPAGATPLRPVVWTQDDVVGLPVEGPTIDLMLVDAPLARVAAEVARLASQVVVLEGVPGPLPKVTLSVRRTPWRAALEQALLSFPGWRLEDREAGGVTVHRPALLRVRADRAPANLVASMVAHLARTDARAPNLITPEEVTGEVTLDLRELDLHDTLRAVAAAVEARVIDEGAVFRLERLRPRDGPAPPQPVAGDTRLKAVAHGPAGWAALVGNRIYMVNDTLLDPETDEVIEGSRVLEIRDEGVRLRERGGERWLPMQGD